MDVATWLHELGLAQYAAAFIENSVSVDLLPSLTADDLKDLGVSAVGHRRRLLNAIAASIPSNRNLPGPTLRSAGSSASCSATSLAPPRCRPGLTQKI